MMATLGRQGTVGWGVTFERTCQGVSFVHHSTPLQSLKETWGSLLR